MKEGDAVSFRSKHVPGRSFGTITEVWGTPDGPAAKIMGRAGVEVVKLTSELEEVTAVTDAEVLRQAAAIVRRHIMITPWPGIATKTPVQLDDLARRLEYEQHLREVRDG